MKYRLLQELLTAELPGPAEMPVLVDAADMVQFAETMLTFCADRMALVPAPYRVNHNIAISAWNQCDVAVREVKSAKTEHQTRHFTGVAREFAVHVAEAAAVNRERVQQQIEWIDQQRADQRRRAGKE